MSTILLVIHILLAIALVLIILIQRNEGGMGGLGGGGGGGGGGMMSSRSAANLLTRATAIIATLFIINSVALAIVAGVERGSFLDDGNGGAAPAAASGDLGSTDAIPSGPATDADGGTAPAPAE